MAFNYVLVAVTVILAVLAVGVALYLLISFQHPEDKNQAWFPKLVVLLGISISIWTVLLFPLDIADRNTCSGQVNAEECSFTLPSKTLWYCLYIANAVLVFGVIPFAMFYYEADSEMTFVKRIIGALAWQAVTLVAAGCILAICYALVGYTVFQVTPLASGLLPLSDLSSNLTTCILPRNATTAPNLQGYLCDAVLGRVGPRDWKTRCSFPVYVIALAACAGWVLFMVFAGTGLVALPVDCVKAFLGRPKTMISRSEFVKRAQALGNRAKQIKQLAERLRQEKRAMGSGRAVRKNLNKINSQLLELEEDHAALELVYPQGDDPGYSWAMTVLGFWAKLAVGIIGAVLSLCWLLQVLLYLFVYPPLTPFLNDAFIRLDRVFPLFGTLAFAVFCFYLIAVTVKGCTKVGLNLLIFTVHPMKPGATLMSSFLFNVGLVLLATNAAIQFCQQAFALYATSAAISEIWGNQILHLEGIRYLFRLHIFLYCLFGFAGLALLLTAFTKPKKWSRKSADKALEEAYAS